MPREYLEFKKLVAPEMFGLIKDVTQRRDLMIISEILLEESFIKRVDDPYPQVLSGYTKDKSFTFGVIDFDEDDPESKREIWLTNHKAKTIYSAVVPDCIWELYQKQIVIAYDEDKDNG